MWFTVISAAVDAITTYNPTLFVRLKVEPFEQWNPGPSFITCKPQRAKVAARNSGTNTAVYNFSRFQLTIRQIRGIRCIGQLEIVETAAYSGFRGSDSGIRNSASGIRGSDSEFRRLMQASIKCLFCETESADSSAWHLNPLLSNVIRFASGIHQKFNVKRFVPQIQKTMQADSTARVIKCLWNPSFKTADSRSGRCYLRLVVNSAVFKKCRVMRRNG